MPAALTRVRDAVADLVAAGAARSPLAEGVFIAVASRLVRSPRLYGFARGRLHTLSAEQRARDARIRRLRAGLVRRSLTARAVTGRQPRGRL